ncbi:MAG: acyl-CoA carboxylase subunit beta [Planctomycetota bacterium]
MPINPLRALNEQFQHTEAETRLGGGTNAIDRQHSKDRLTARERIEGLVDDPGRFQELALWAAHNMYAEHGGAPAAGVVTGIGPVEDRLCMIIANDATVKAGAFFPMTCKKIIRAQTIARRARLPLLYLVDSAGVFLPLQEDVFPDTDDFGRIFYLNAVLSAEGIPQIAAIMGNCVAGGGYLPVLCDTLLMTEGSGLYLAGPALVKAAIGQEVSDEELGGATMHAAISGTIDFKEPSDEACLERLRSLVAKHDAMRIHDRSTENAAPARTPEAIYDIFPADPTAQYDVREVIATVVDSRSRRQDAPATEHEDLIPDFDEYKADYGMSLVCGYTRIGGHACGIVANQKQVTKRTMPGGFEGPNYAVNMPGVIYDDAADKAARFIMDCNQRKLPLIFLHDTSGFMVGRDSEQAGIIRSGAKMVNAMSNCIVPKIVLILGGSYGAGNYAMCGRAFEPFLTFAWPGARCAVMSAASATGTLAMIEERARARRGEEIDRETHDGILKAVADSYEQHQDIRHGAARLWVDRIIQPHETRTELAAALDAAGAGTHTGWFDRPEHQHFSTGVLQV